ncbi:MAG: amidohydrolase [Bacteroidia bacterium]|nr:amidohydrolase [Bacteroidia bacterium]
MINTHQDELYTVIIQPEIVWENIEQNINNFSVIIDEIIDEHNSVDLIILPEMFTTGFTMNPTYIAETMEGITIKWMKELAKNYNFAICGSLIIENKSKFFNRFIFVKPSGETDYYDKKHLFSFAGEDNNYTEGKDKILINYKGWKINPFICYDLRFPVWCRNTDNSDLLIFVANWPSKRISHWQKLLLARAIENQCYTIGVNRVGHDNNNLEYNGMSCIINPLGNEIINLQHKPGYGFFILKKSELNSIRESLPFMQDRDNFNLI